MIIACSLSAACADLERYELNGQCGNHIVEASFGEDCDAIDAACGAPNTRFACRFICAAGTACPAHWACGIDGLCRPEDAPLEADRVLDVYADTGRVVAAHLDEDTALDLIRLSKSEVRVRFGDRDRPLEAGAVLTSVENASGAAIADFDGDGRSDVIVPADEGLHILRSRKGRALVPYADARAIPTGREGRVEFFALHGSAREPFQDLVRVWIREGSVEVLAGDDLDAPPELVDHPCSSDPAGCSQLEVVPLGDLTGDGTDEVAASRFNDDRLELYTARCSHTISGLRRCALLPFGRIAVPDVLTTRVLAADLDQNGTRDLLIENPIGGTLAVSYNDGAGNFCAQPHSELGCAVQDQNTARPAERFLGFKDCTGIPTFPRRAVDLDRDGDVDFIADGIYLSNGTAFDLATCLNATAVITADLNGDGFPEIIDEAPRSQLDLYVGTDRGVFSRRSIMLPTSVQDAASGDFDGDGIEDVVFLGQHTEERAAVELRIIYGSRDLSALTAVLAGEMRTRRLPKLITGDLFGENGLPWWQRSAQLDLAGDIVIRAGGNLDDAELGMFSGTGDRALSPLRKVDLRPVTMFREHPRPYLIAAGDFTGDAKRELLVLLGDGFGLDKILEVALLLEASSDDPETRTWTETFLPLSDCSPEHTHFGGHPSAIRLEGEHQHVLFAELGAPEKSWIAAVTPEGLRCRPLEPSGQSNHNRIVAVAPFFDEGLVTLLGRSSGDAVIDLALSTQRPGALEEINAFEGDQKIHAIAVGAGHPTPRLIAISQERIDELERIDRRWTYARTLSELRPANDGRDGVEPGIFLAGSAPIFADFNEDRLSDVVLNAPVSINRNAEERGPPGLPGLEATLFFPRESEVVR